MGLHRHFERIIVAASAVALQVALYLLLTEPVLFLSKAKSPPALAVMIVNAARPSRQRAFHRDAITLRAPKRVIEPLMVQPITPPELRMNAAGPAVDWQAAISREVRTRVSHAPRPKLRFGFPRAPAKQSLPPAFEGWDEVRIHRVQRLANGIFDLGPCVIRLSYPIPLCHFDTPPANGKLFKHMHRDRTTVGSLP